MNLNPFKKPMNEARLEDLIKAGFVDLKISPGEGDIWGKDNYRMIYDPIHDKVVRGYEIKGDTKVKPLSISEVSEILHYIDSHHEKQTNEGSE